MKWPWSPKETNDPVIGHLQRRLAELVGQLGNTQQPKAALPVYLPDIERVIALFLELGHVYAMRGRPAEQAQVKAQAAKFMLVLPAQHEINYLSYAQVLLTEAVAELAKHDQARADLADAQVVLGEFVSREAVGQPDAAQRRARFDEAEEHLRQALALLAPPDTAPAGSVAQQVADIHNKLGNIAKSRAGTQPGDREVLLRMAEQHFHDALKVCDAETSPDMFALTQNNLGSVQIMALGERVDADALHAAGERFHAALRAISRQRQPHLHAMVHSNLGELDLALTQAGTGSRFELLQSAVSHFGEALTAFPPEVFPAQHAKILYGQGRALALMGQKDEARRLLKEALEYRHALPDEGRQIEKTLDELHVIRN